MADKSFSAEEIDTSKAHPARMYDFYLGGLDNYEVDREAAQRVLDAVPDAVPTARANRAFLGRAVRFIAAQGISQFLDVGTGIPTSPNTHELARSVVPDAKVAYVDNDPIVAAHAGARLTNTENTAFFLGDLREPKAVLASPALRELIDLRQPVGLMLIAVAHFVTDEEGVYEAVATLADALPKGSCMALSHCTRDIAETDIAETDIAETDIADGGAFGRLQETYNKATAPLLVRTKAEVSRFFEGFDLVDPGIVHLPRWRPESPESPEWNRVHLYAGIGVKR